MKTYIIDSIIEMGLVKSLMNLDSINFTGCYFFNYVTRRLIVRIEHTDPTAKLSNEESLIAIRKHPFIKNLVLDCLDSFKDVLEKNKTQRLNGVKYPLNYVSRAKILLE